MKRKIALFVAAVVVAAGAVLAIAWSFRRHSEMLRLPGVVEIQEVRIGSKVGGRVAKVCVMEGQVVAPGQELVVFEAPELEAQREQWKARLQAAEAELDKARNGPRVEEKEAARAALEAATAKWQRLKVGFREEEKRQARNDLVSAEADLKLALEDFDRAQRLFEKGSMARADFDVARAARDRARGRADAARARFDLMTAGSRPEEIAEAAGDMAKAKANLDLLLAGTRSEDIAAAEASVAEARGKLREVEANLNEAVVRAPERAVIEVLGVRKGDLVAPNQPILRVLRAEDLWVKVYVPETQLGKVRLNQQAEVTIDAYPGRHFTGQVIQIASESEFTPRNVQSVDERRHQVFGIKVCVPDPDGVFKSGMAAEVLLPLHGAGE